MEVRVNYDPLEDQLSFHVNPSLWRLAAGGVRSGKTYAGAHEFLVMILEGGRDLDYLMIAPYNKTLRSVTLREFRKILDKIPGLFIRDVKRPDEQYLLLSGNRRVYYRSAENPVSYEGLTVAGVWVDEGRYIKRDAWDIAIARLSSPNAKMLRGIVTTTPSMGWLFDEFKTGKANRSITKFRTDKNYWLHDGYVENLRDSLSAEKAKQYLKQR